MKKYSYIITLLFLTGFCVNAQEDCNADGGLPILPSTCVENTSISLPITDFDISPSGTTAFDFVFTAPVVNDTVERIIGVTQTGTFDFSLDTLTMQPFAPGVYGVTVIAYNAEDLFDLTTNPAVSTFDCIEGNGEETLAEVLDCVQSLGLIMNTLTIDLVINNILEGFAPIALMREMCYDFSEKVSFTLVDGATESCTVGIDRNIDAPNFHFEPNTSTLHLFDFESIELQNIVLSDITGAQLNNFLPSNQIRLPSLATGIYILDFVTTKGRVARQIAVY